MAAVGEHADRRRVPRRARHARLRRPCRRRRPFGRNARRSRASRASRARDPAMARGQSLRTFDRVETDSEAQPRPLRERAQTLGLRPDAQTGYARKMSSMPPSAMTSASPSVPDRDAAWRRVSSWIRASGDALVRLDVRPKRRARAAIASAMRRALRSTMSRSMTSVGVSMPPGWRGDWRGSVIATTVPRPQEYDKSSCPNGRRLRILRWALPDGTRGSRRLRRKG